MKCLRHGKEAEYQCQWCGKKICELCIGKRDGKKVFCHDCHNKIGHLSKERTVKKAAEKTQQDNTPQKTEDGYIIIEGDK